MTRFFVALCALLFVSCSKPIYTSKPQQQAIFVLAGGGSEGDIGDASSWSYLLYRELLRNGDTNDDGLLVVAILASKESQEPNFLPDYFDWLGATLRLNVSAQNVLIPTRADANDEAKLSVLERADVVFVKGGDQGVYYDEWNDTLLEARLRAVVARRGAIGGTSAGAMILVEFSFSGGQDLISEDVLTDACSPNLNDPHGGSGVHTDFLSLLPSLVVDTHFTARGRLGRLLGILAKASDDSSRGDLLAVGIESRTGVVIRDNIAQVVGVGEVSFLRQSKETTMRRVAGDPLVYTSLSLDRLTHGWRFDLTRRAPLTDVLPEGAEVVTPKRATLTQSVPLQIAGDQPEDVQKFEWLASISPKDYLLQKTSASFFVEGTIGFVASGHPDSRMHKQESLFRAIYDQPGAVGFLVFRGGALHRSKEVICFEASGDSPEMASIVIDGGFMTHRGLSPFVSNNAIEGGTLRAASLLALRVHVLASGELLFDLRDGSLAPSVFPVLENAVNATLESSLEPSRNTDSLPK